MTLPLLKYSLTSQNHRVNGYEIPGDEQPRIYNLENLSSEGKFNELIYRENSLLPECHDTTEIIVKL